MAKTTRSYNDTQVFEHLEAADAKRVVIVDATGNVLASFAIAGNVGVLDSAGNRINPAKEDGNLALIKAKTDNLDLATTALRDALRGASSKTLTDIVNALASVPVTGTFWQATQPISAASLPLPTGAATEATLASIKDTDGIKKITNALPAGTNLLGKVSSSLETSTIYDGITALVPKFKKIDLAASGDLITLVSSKKLRIIGGFLTVAADTTLKFQSGASTDLTGAMTVKAGGGFVWGQNANGYFETASGEKLNLVMGTSVQVSGSLTYLEV